MRERTNVIPHTDAAERRALRREQVIRAARACFEREGLHAATMAHIAAEAGMGVGHIYHYFNSREAIVVEVARRDLEYCLTMLLPTRSTAELATAMMLVVEGEAHGAQSDPPLSPALRAELMAEAGRNGCIASLIDDTENRCRAYLRGFMSRKVASPDDPTRDAEAVVELVLATWRGLLARGCASADTPSLTPALRALLEAQGSPSSEAHAVTALRP
jgi:AcrR family transcriptional regulator